jgi:hypothetical protein
MSSSQFDTLSQQFNKLLSEYKETYKNYTNAINTKDSSLKQIPDSAFIGESNISLLAGSSIDACEASCSSNTLCTGATFNSSNNNCTLGSGNGKITKGTNSVAIVQQALYYSNKLKQINIQMTEINKQMINLSKDNYKQINQNQQQSSQQEEIMYNNYNILTDERLQIENLSRQFQTINAAYIDTNAIVNENYTKYIVFVFVALLLVLFIIKLAFSSSQSGGSKHILDKKPNIATIMGVFCFIIIINAIITNK